MDVVDSLRAMFSFDTAGITHSKGLGETAFVDAEPGISEATNLDTMFVGVNPDQPAVNTNPESVTDLLQEIRNNTAHGNPEPYWQPIVIQLPAASGEVSVSAFGDFRNVFVHKAPRQIDVYMGIGQSFFLGTVPVGKSLRAKFPFPQNGITIVYPSAGTVDTLPITMSSEEFRVDIV